jgi:hypothetical protein
LLASHVLLTVDRTFTEQEVSMNNYLITGMPGTGKSVVLEALRSRGFEGIETDTPEFSQWVSRTTGKPVDGPAFATPNDAQDLEWVWNEPAIDSLLDRPATADRFIGGISSNQVKFYPRFARIFLLEVSLQLLQHRLTYRTTNDFGKQPPDLAFVLGFAPRFNELLRNAGALAVDASVPLDEVVEAIVERRQS